jgi:glycerol uptake facilitator-like aquaporin
MQRKLIAEAFGTFGLALAVLASLHLGTSVVTTPVVAGLTLALFVYSIGERSGCHINPAVTLGLWSINKIKTAEAIRYIIAQVIGAAAAYLIATAFITTLSLTLLPESLDLFLAELMGTLFFTFGIAAVVYGRVSSQVSGIVVGGSLLLGIIIALAFGSAGVLNPAVALAVGTINLSYILGAIFGAMLGMNLYRKFIS